MKNIKKNNIQNKNELIKQWFNNWSNEYDQTLGSFSFHRELLDLVVQNSKLKTNEKVLDIGCGTGLLSIKILQQVDCKITAIDNSNEMLKIFQEKIKKLDLKDRVTCQLIDMNSIKSKKNYYDLIVSSVVLHHLEKKLEFLKKVHKILKPKGSFIIGEVDMDTTGKLEDTKRLKRILKALEEEWIVALNEIGVSAFTKMYENGIRHILNRGEYCLSLEQWAELCQKAGFKKTIIKYTPHYKSFGIVIAEN